MSTQVLWAGWAWKQPGKSTASNLGIAQSKCRWFELHGPVGVHAGANNINDAHSRGAAAAASLLAVGVDAAPQLRYFKYGNCNDGGSDVVGAFNMCCASGVEIDVVGYSTSAGHGSGAGGARGMAAACMQPDGPTPQSTVTFSICRCAQHFASSSLPSNDENSSGSGIGSAPLVRDAAASRHRAQSSSSSSSSTSSSSKLVLSPLCPSDAEALVAACRMLGIGSSSTGGSIHTHNTPRALPAPASSACVSRAAMADTAALQRGDVSASSPSLSSQPYPPPSPAVIEPASSPVLVLHLPFGVGTAVITAPDVRPALESRHARIDVDAVLEAVCNAVAGHSSSTSPLSLNKDSLRPSDAASGSGLSATLHLEHSAPSAPPNKRALTAAVLAALSAAGSGRLALVPLAPPSSASPHPAVPSVASSVVACTWDNTMTLQSKAVILRYVAPGDSTAASGAFGGSGMKTASSESTGGARSAQRSRSRGRRGSDAFGILSHNSTVQSPSDKNCASDLRGDAVHWATDGAAACASPLCPYHTTSTSSHRDVSPHGGNNNGGRHPVTSPPPSPPPPSPHAHLLLLPFHWMPPAPPSARVASWRTTNDCYGDKVTAYSIHVTAGNLRWECEHRFGEFQQLHAALGDYVARSTIEHHHRHPALPPLPALHSVRPELRLRSWASRAMAARPSTVVVAVRGAVNDRRTPLASPLQVAASSPLHAEPLLRKVLAASATATTSSSSSSSVYYERIATSDSVVTPTSALLADHTAASGSPGDGGGGVAASPLIVAALDDDDESAAATAVDGAVDAEQQQDTVATPTRITAGRAFTRGFSTLEFHVGDDDGDADAGDTTSADVNVSIVNVSMQGTDTAPAVGGLALPSTPAATAAAQPRTILDTVKPLPQHQPSARKQSPQDRRRVKLDRWLRQVLTLPASWSCTAVLSFVGLASEVLALPAPHSATSSSSVAKVLSSSASSASSSAAEAGNIDLSSLSDHDAGVVVTGSPLQRLLSVQHSGVSAGAATAAVSIPSAAAAPPPLPPGRQDQHQKHSHQRGRRGEIVGVQQQQQHEPGTQKQGQDLEQGPVSPIHAVGFDDAVYSDGPATEGGGGGGNESDSASLLSSSAIIVPRPPSKPRVLRQAPQQKQQPDAIAHSAATPPGVPYHHAQQQQQHLQHHLPATLPLSRVPDILCPGDVLLFCCKNGPSTLQRAATGCRYDHAGIVVDANWNKRAGSGTTGFDPAATGHQSSSSSNSKHAYDLQLLEASGDGVKCYPLVGRLRAYGTGYCHTIAVRRLLLAGEECLVPGSNSDQQDLSPKNYSAATGDHASGVTGSASILRPCGDDCCMYKRRNTCAPLPPAAAAAAVAPTLVPSTRHEKGLGTGSTPQSQRHPRWSPPLSSSSAGCPCAIVRAQRVAIESRIGAFIDSVKGKATYSLSLRKLMVQPAHFAAGRLQRSAVTRTLRPADATAVSAAGSTSGDDDDDANAAAAALRSSAVLSCAPYLPPPSLSAAIPLPHYYCTEVMAAAYQCAGLIPAQDTLRILQQTAGSGGGSCIVAVPAGGVGGDSSSSASIDLAAVSDSHQQHDKHGSSSDIAIHTTTGIPPALLDPRGYWPNAWVQPHPSLGAPTSLPSSASAATSGAATINVNPATSPEGGATLVLASPSSATTTIGYQLRPRSFIAAADIGFGGHGNSAGADAAVDLLLQLWMPLLPLTQLTQPTSASAARSADHAASPSVPSTLVISLVSRLDDEMAIDCRYRPLAWAQQQQQR